MVRLVIKKIFIAIFLASAVSCGGGYQVNEEDSTPQAAATTTVPDRPTLESKITELLANIAASKNDAAVKTILKGQLEKASAKLQEESLEDSELESIAATLDTIEAQNTIAQNSVTAASTATTSGSSASTSSGSTSMLNLSQLSTDSGTPLTVKSNLSTFTQLGLFTSDYVSSTVGSGLIFGKGTTSGDTYSTIDAVKSSGGADLVLQGSGGKVGIGTASPGTALDVIGGIRTATNGFAVGNLPLSATTAVLRTPNDYRLVDDGSLKFNNAAVTAMTIDSSGNIGIATASPSTNLDINGNTTIRGDLNFVGSKSIAGGTMAVTTQMSFDTAPNFIRDVGASIKIQPKGDAQLTGNALESYASSGAATPAFVLKRNGSVGINTTAPGYPLTVNGQPGANGYTLFTNYSDRRLKTDIKPLEEGMLAKVMALKPSSFYYNKLTGYDEKTRSRKLHGFIAQDLEEVFPEMVAETKIGGKNYLDANLSFLQIYLVKAMQELKAGIDNLFESQSERISKIEAENADLKAALCEMRPEAKLCKK